MAFRRIIGLTPTPSMPLFFVKPPPWNPGDLSNLRGFWVPEDLGLTAGSAVPSLPSSGGVTNTLTQSVSTARPVYSLQNSKGALTFDGTDDALLTENGGLTNGAQAVMFFTLIKVLTIPVAATNYSAIMRCPLVPGGAAPRIAVAIDNATKKWCLQARITDAGGIVPFVSTVVADTNPHVLIGVFNPGGQFMRMYLDGTRIMNLNPASPYTFPASDIAPTMIGNTVNNTLGPHGLIKASTEFSTLERQKTEGWLAHYWGIQANLPSDHPFKLAPPP